MEDISYEKRRGERERERERRKAHQRSSTQMARTRLELFAQRKSKARDMSLMNVY